MNTPQWFDRQFDFNFNADQYAAIHRLLQSAPGRLQLLVKDVPEELLVLQPEGKWSIKEHIGHLSLLEPLWRVRFQDIIDQKPILSPADLSNSATTAAGFNQYAVIALLQQFSETRSTTLDLLTAIDVSVTYLTSLHPRLQQPMRIIDLAYFVAEHDLHHQDAIEAIINLRT